MVDFDTFAKSDFRAVKILACEAVPKSKKLLKFTLDDGERKDRVILSGIHEYYEPEELVGKTAIAIVNLPPRKMMGIDSEGMLISAVHEEDGHEGLNLLMVNDRIPAGAKLYYDEKQSLAAVCACKHRHKAKNAWRRQSRWILEKNEWAIKKNQRQRTLGELFFLLMKGQTLFSADPLAFKGLILFIYRFSDF